MLIIRYNKKFEHLSGQTSKFGYYLVSVYKVEVFLFT